MASYPVEIVFVEGSTFFSLRLPKGAALIQLKKCPASLQQKFTITSGENLVSVPDALLDEFKHTGMSGMSGVPGKASACVVKHRGTLCIKIQGPSKSQVYPLAFFPNTTIQHLLRAHYSDNTFAPLVSLDASSITILNQYFGFLPSSTPGFEHIFRNNFWTEISPLLKLKLDVHFGNVFHPSLPMTESPLPVHSKPELIASQYFRGSLLGEGTYGQVYEIKQSSVGEAYALKIMRKTHKEDLGTFFKTLLSETSGLALCSSFYDIKISDPNTLQFFMPLYGKLNLDKHISFLRNSSSSVSSPALLSQSQFSPPPSSQPLTSPLPGIARPTQILSAEQHLGIFRGIISVLHKLHSRGMAHLDIKMCNIIGPLADFSCKLVDFGLSSLQEGPQKEVLKTTLDTRDPAIFQGKECFTWSDIWSMGVIFSDLVADKRFSVISYRKPGFWPDGKKYDWDREETKLCLKFIEEKVNDDDLLDNFLLGLDQLSQDNPNLTVGTAYILSNSLWKNPGKRSSFGLSNSYLRPGLAKWPYPVFSYHHSQAPGSATSATVADPQTSPSRFHYLIQEKHRGHFLLDGSGPFQSLSDIPVLPEIKYAVSPEKRKYQLHFMASVLLDLREFNIKTFLLAVDILDRVSSPQALHYIKSVIEPPSLAFVALETSCIFFALMQACPSEPALESVVQKSLDNLPLEYSRAPFCLKQSLPKLWEIVLNLLSTVRFQQVWKNSLWNELVNSGKINSQNYIKGVFEGLVSWPDGKQTTSEFLSGTTVSSHSSIFAANVPQRKTSLDSSWITTEFQCLISSSPFWDVYIFNPKTSAYPPLPDSPPLHSTLHSHPSLASEKSGSLSDIEQYLETFIKDRQHPFMIPFPPTSLISNVTRSEFTVAVDKYITKVTSHIPKEVCEGKKCIVCLEDSETPCKSCGHWSLCSSCTLRWEGRCSQCLVPTEVEEWKTVSKL